MAAVPAWKRLGLKLKGPSSDASPNYTAAQTTTTSANAHSTPSAASQYGNSGFNKRKQLPPNPYPASDFKRPRRDDYSNSAPSRKSVSFSQDTTTKAKPAPKKPKKKKAPKRPPPSKQDFDLTPALEYLRNWNTARDSWKFNKNHQTLLIKYLYESDAIPSADIDAFYTYIRDIKGASRQRLVEQAQDICKKDMEAGTKGFPEGVKAPKEKQKEYEEMLAELLKKKAELKSGDGANSGSGGDASKKRCFDEVDFVLRTAVDKGIQQRIVKRMRAETVVDELESSDTGESSSADSAATRAATSRVKVAAAGDEANGAKQNTKRKKKLRTAGSDSSSSSDSDSESSASDSDSDDDDDDDATGGQGEADNDSASSSSSSDSDEEMNDATTTTNGVQEDDSDSSSSSSSSPGSDSESESSAAEPRAAVEDTSGSDGDSEDSDSDDDDE